MAQNKSTAYPSFVPISYWRPSSPIVSSPMVFMSPQYGLDTSTGKRDSKKTLNNSFTPGIRPDPNTASSYPQLPTFTVAGPMDADLYTDLAEKLDKKRFLSDFKEQLLGLGSGVAFSAATLPFAERLRNLDYQLGLQADIQSPTRQAERDVSRQSQFKTASDAVSDRLRALAAVRQGAASGVNVSI